VLKVELPGVGDQSRWLPSAPDNPRSAYFEACNRGKRSCTIDLRTPPGREAFLRLTDRSDVIISNFSPGTMEGWGLGYEDVAARNPSVVYALGSTFGHRGPDAHREGADLAGQAAGGLISTTGSAGDPLTPVGATIADHVGSQNLVAGILAALFARERTGQGQRVETSLLGGQIWAQASEITACLLTGRPVGRAQGGNALVPGLYGIFPTADGWIAVVGAGGPLRATLFELLGRPELTERFDQPVYWDQEKAELFPLLGEAFARRSTAEWCEALDGAGIRHAPVRDHAEVVADPGAWENEYLREVAGTDGPARIATPPVRFSATPAEPRGDVPVLGQHTEEVLAELGYSGEDIAGLREQAAI
jgi:crotonobetainyl-CoA:carnitine CoA-transferase CaiB-like acyl-CoA transferase